jgi:hypothetical protein
VQCRNLCTRQGALDWPLLTKTANLGPNMSGVIAVPLASTSHKRHAFLGARGTVSHVIHSEARVRLCIFFVGSEGICTGKMMHPHTTEAGPAPLGTSGCASELRFPKPG